MLLDLPPELVQLVLLNCTPTTFLQAAFTCRTLYRIASGCREALVHQLRRTPGPRLDFPSLNTNQLFPLLKRHAFGQLCGSQFYADCVTFEFGERIPNSKASSLAGSADQTLVFTVCRDQRIVHTFRVGQGQLQLLARAKLPSDQPGSVEVLKTAYGGGDWLYVLQRFTPSVDEHDSDAEHPFVKQARESGRNGTLYLTCHSLKSPDEPVRVCAFPEYADYEPSALAANDDGVFAISWYHPLYPNHEIVLHTTVDESEYDCTSDLVGFSCTTRLLHRCFRNNTQGPWITDLAFNDRLTQLLCYHPGDSLYGSFQKIDRPGARTVYENATSVRFTDSLHLLFSIGVPFFGTHETQVDHAGFQVCRWRYLALGIARHREENWTVACLLRSEAICRSNRCGHVLNLDRGRRLNDWVITARLWGFRESTNSLGCRIAVSKLGTRIAVANWNMLYVWALEPGSLIDHGTGYYDPSLRSRTNGHIELQPIVLHLGAVCFQLRFTDAENELVTITDRGVMLWDLSPTGRGSRTCQELPV